jgi:ATP-dependent Clp protease, protease subunit
MSLTAESTPSQPPQWRPMPSPMPSPMPAPERRSPLPMILTPLAPEPGPDDVTGQLLDRRILLLTGRLDHETAELAAARLLLLDERSHDPVTMHVGCPAGELEAALTVMATLDLVASTVTAVAVGTIGGAAVAVYAAAATRVAHPHVSFLLHDPSIEPSDDIRDLSIAAEQRARELTTLHERIARACGKDIGAVADDRRSGRLLTADEAVSYGLVEAITSRR